VSEQVKVVWRPDREDQDPGQPNTVWVIRHGKTFYHYLNIGRDEAERRFKAEAARSEEFCFGLAELDGPVARGFSASFTDSFSIWVDPAEQVLETLNRMFASPARAVE
jgi:hypothetical protein